MQKHKALAFTGHRPESLPFGENELSASAIRIKTLLADDEGAAVLGFAAVDALRLENVNEGRANLASDDFDRHSVFLSARMGHSIKSTNGTEMFLIVVA